MQEYKQENIACRIDKPPMVVEKEADCDQAWSVAEAVVPENKRSDFKEAAILQIKDGKDKYFCYKKSDWQQGWCSIGNDAATSGWGVCSISCDLFKKR